MPRAKIHLVENAQGQQRVIGVEDDALDVTSRLLEYAQTFLNNFPHLKFFITKSRSPSCGYKTTPLNKIPIEEGDYSMTQSIASGLFINQVNCLKPDIFIIDEQMLAHDRHCDRFLTQLLSSVQ